MCGGVKHLYEIYEYQKLRLSLGVPPEAKLLFSVGELNKNKNHEAVIRAMAYIKDKTIHYAIAGVGELQENLVMLAEEPGLRGRVHFLGYRADVPRLYKVADLYIHPSYREGLSVALMEAIAAKVPVICSDIRGNADLVVKNAMFKPDDIFSVARKVEEYLSASSYRETCINYNNLKKYDIRNVIKGMKLIYDGSID